MTASRHPQTAGEVVAARARTTPGAEALVDERNRFTYAELDQLVTRVAGGLAARGLGPGDRLGVSLPNSADIVVAFLACTRVGVVFVGVHPGLHPRERDRLLTVAGADLLLTTTGGRGHDVAAGTWSGDSIELDLAGSGIAVVAGPPPPLPPPAPTDVAAIAFTSGTTGRPKGVVHDHRHTLLTPEVILHDRMGGRSERVGAVLPLTTLNVMILAPVFAFLGGGSCVCLAGPAPADLVTLVTDEGIDHLMCSPATAHDLVETETTDHHGLAALRLGVGGATCPESLRVAYRQRFGVDFTSGYGLSEAPAAVTQETSRHPHRTGASGVALAHLDVRVVDDEGTPVDPGTLGQIAVAPAVNGTWAGRWSGMIGYWRDPEGSASARRHGVLLTGDEGRLDADGYLYVADRRADMINRGGSKVSPAEVERVLREHPAVADCVVLGRTRPRLGEEVVALVERRPGAELDKAELTGLCRDHLAGFKVPAQLEVVDRLPRNAMGKVARGPVLAALAAAINGGEAL